MYAYVNNNPVSFVDPTGLGDEGNNRSLCGPSIVDFEMCFGGSGGGGSSGSSGGGLGAGGGTPGKRPFGSKPINRTWSKQFPCNQTTPQQLSSTVRNDFSDFANLTPPTGPSAVFTPGPLTLGETVQISVSYETGNYAPGMTAEVTVTSVTPTSWTFTVLPGQPHFMAPGSTISFSASQGPNGSSMFTVTANGETANAFFSLADLLGGQSAETGTWQNLLNKIALGCQQ